MNADEGSLPVQETPVIVDIRVRDGNQIIGYTEQVSRERWERSLIDRRIIVRTVVDTLLESLEGHK